MRLKHALLPAAVVAGAIWVMPQASDAQAEPPTQAMSQALEKYQAAAHDLVGLYTRAKAVSILIAEAENRRQRAEAAIEKAFLAIDHEDAEHGNHAEGIFAGLQNANAAIEKAYLEALEAQASAQHEHAEAVALQGGVQ